MDMARENKIYAATLSVVFLFFLTLPFLVFLFAEHQEISTAEKRKLAVFPDPVSTTADLVAYPEQFDTYYNDHFGFRDSMIKLYNAALLDFFRIAPSDFIIKGKDGWFFYTGEGVLEDFLRQRQVSQASLEKNASTLIDRRDWLASLGTHYLFVPVPNKIGMYDEKLPVRVRSNKGLFFYEQFIPFLKNETTFTDVIDLYSFFQEKKQDKQLYFKTDTHWTNDGALLAFNEIINHCSKWFPGLQPVTEEEIIREVVPFSGDLASLMHQRESVSENVAVVKLKNPCVRDEGYQPPPSLQTLKTAVSEDSSRFPMENGCPEKSLTILVIHDSFGNFVHRYFTDRFKRVIYSPYITIEGLKELIIEERPDIVIELWVARNFGRLLTQVPGLREERIAKQFAASDKVQLQINGSFDLQTLQSSHELHLENHENGLSLEALGNDPFLIVPFQPESSKEGERYAIEVEIDAPAETWFALYYTTKEKPEKILPHQVVQQEIHKGYNRLLFRLPHPEVRGIMRIDPGSLPGRYFLRSLTVKTVKGATKSPQ